MPSIQMRMGLAARQVDSELSAAQGRYPRELPLTHFSVLLGWEPKIPLKQVITALIGWYKKNRGPIGQIGPVVIHYKLTKKENGYRAT